MSKKNCFFRRGCCGRRKACLGAAEKRCQPGEKASLAQLVPGQTGIITEINSALRAAAKFAHIGMIAGTRVLLEAYAPFGGLMRVRLLDCSMALHFQEAQHIMVRVEQ